MLGSAHRPGESVAYMAHMGGLLFGYIWLKFIPRRGFAHAASERAFGLRNWYYRWKRKRAVRKFEVYMRKHDDRGDYKQKTTSTSMATSATPAPATTARQMATQHRRG